MRSRWSVFWVLAGLILLSLNLRPAAVSVGPVLKELQAGLEMNGATAGLLTSLPTLAFAVFGAFAPAFARRVGVHRAVLISILVLVTGLAWRATAPNLTVLIAASALALAGMAVANVLLPSLVKRHFPDHIGVVTAIYTTGLSLGTAGALMLTVPIAEATGGWRGGLGTWAALALLAAVPWVVLARHDRRPSEPSTPLPFFRVLRTPLGMAMALFFGIQSTHAYVIFGWFATLWRDAGYSANDAGLLVGLLASIAIPMSLILPAVVARVRDPRWTMLAVLACYPVGYLTLLFAPHSLGLPAAFFVGVGTSVFPVVLVLIGMRARTPEGTAALSGVTQSVGYAISGFGPIGLGVLHDATGGWTVPLTVLLVLVIPLVALTFYLGRPHYIEDQLASR